MIGSVRLDEHSYHCCPTLAAVAFDYLLIAAAGRFLSLCFLHFFTDHQVPALEKNFHLWGMVVHRIIHRSVISQHQYSALEKEYCKSVTHFCLLSNDDEVVHVTTPYLRP